MKHKKEDKGRWTGVYPEEVGQFLLEIFAEDIQSKRMRQGFTLRDIGKLIGVSHVTIGNYERRTSLPPVPEFLTLCGLFNLDPMRYWLRPDNIPEQLSLPGIASGGHG